MESWFVLIGSAAFVILLPRWGVLALMRNRRNTRRRERLEDALKYLLDCQSQGRHASADALAGNLRLAQREVAGLVEALEAQGLITSHGVELALTPAGERWAMHVLRAHRLWERYLADEARMPLEQVHREAHHREHGQSEANLNELDAALGFPTYDPHGDPIPNRDGKLNQVESVSITAMLPGQAARIVHLEDEPPLAYQQILASGLRLGQFVRLLERTPERVTLSDGENEYRLAPAVASNISVSAFPEPALEQAGVIALAELAHQQKAEIVALDEAVQGFTRRRFMDLGLTPGAIIWPELQNFFGEPRAYRIRGTLIALRKDQATQIRVKPVLAQDGTVVSPGG
jgi:DtxR family Mn-dependent transcriptional regulator